MRIGTPIRGTSNSGVRTRIPPAIWALGFVSLLMDVSSELIHSLLPVFLVTSLGASIAGVVFSTFALGAIPFSRSGTAPRS